MAPNSDYTVNYEKKKIGWVSENFSVFTLKDVNNNELGVYNGGEINGKLLVKKYDYNQKIIHQILLPMDTLGHWYNNERIFQLFKDTQLEKAEGTGDFNKHTFLKF